LATDLSLEFTTSPPGVRIEGSSHVGISQIISAIYERFPSPKSLNFQPVIALSRKKSRAVKSGALIAGWRALKQTLCDRLRARFLNREKAHAVPDSGCDHIAIDGLNSTSTV
jgi:hypothetical protein